jgi:hypothetical protein
MLRVALKYSGLSVEEKLKLAKKIYKMLTGNANFPTPNPTLDDILDLIDEAEKSMTASDEAVDVSIRLKAAMHKNFDALGDGLHKLGNYVETTANGDPLIIESAGFTPVSKTSPIGKLAQAQNCGISTGDNAGEIDPHCDAVKGAKAYDWQINTADPVKDDEWKDAITSTKSTCSILNLTSGIRVWIRVAAVGAAGRGPWSDPATKIVP